MSGYEAPCPSCGGTIVFSLGSTLLKVCEHCGSAVARKGADLQAYGKVASLIPTPSVLALGVRGGYEGAPPFELVGRLQLGYASGTWDEWLMAFSGDTWAWLSESQGKFHYMGAAPLPPVPEFEHVRVGETVDLGPPGTFVITERRTAKFVTAQGELPFDVKPGSALHYADLSGPGGQFATLDYGTGQIAEALYVGREVGLDEMGMRGLPRGRGAPEARRRRDAVVPELRGPPRDPRPRPDAARGLPLLRLAARRDEGPGDPAGHVGGARPAADPARLEGDDRRDRVDGHRLHGAQRHRRGHPLPLARVPALRAAAGVPLARRVEGSLELRGARQRRRREDSSVSSSIGAATGPSSTSRAARPWSTTWWGSSTGRWPGGTRPRATTT